MRCGRCRGLMVVEPIYDAKGLPVSGAPPSARCLNCGNIEDDMICFNRLVLLHRIAQCLHIWNSDGVKNKYFFSTTGFVEEYLSEAQTFCCDDSQGRSFSTGGLQGDEENGSAGS